MQNNHDTDPIDIQQPGNEIDLLDEQDAHSQFSQDFHSNPENPHQLNNPNHNDNDEEPNQQHQHQPLPTIPKVTCPISAYSVFMREWRERHVGEKMSMAAIGEIWKELGAGEREVYEKKFRDEKQKYEEYEAMMLAIDPNFKNKVNKNSSKNYFFPLHRVKAIMKQDPSFTTSTENVCAMARTAQYFGQYLLQQIKKVSEGKKRIDMSNLFEAINNNQNNLWFLNCLIDQHNLDGEGKGHHGVEGRKSNQLTVVNDYANDANEKNSGMGLHITEEKKSIKKTEKQPTQTQRSAKKKQIPKNQLKLTDMF